MTSINRRDFLKKGAATVAGSIAGLHLLNGQAATPPAPSVKTGFYFSGNNSQVLAEAQKAIARNRMRQVELRLTDRRGKPLRNKPVEVVQKQHAFLFGDQNVIMDQYLRQGKAYLEKLEHLRRLHKDLFTALNNTCYWTERPRNNMKKTEPLQGDYRYESFEKSVDWTNAHGLTAKGHPVFWTVPKAIPAWLKRYPVETQWKFVEVRVRSLIARFKGRVNQWDVVNEAMWEPALKNLPKRHWPYLETTENMVEYIGRTLQWCREENPEGKYLINDYGIGGAVREDLKTRDGQAVTVQLQRKRYKELVRALQENGTPVDGMGLQCHHGWLSPKEQVAFYDEMSQAGVPLHITEFWPGLSHFDNPRNLSGEELKAYQEEYIENYLTTAFAHPNVDSFFFWGFMGKALDISDGPSPSIRKLPLYNRIYELINKKWHTQKQLTTDSDGKIRFKGFYGQYALRFLAQNQDKAQTGLPFEINSYQGMPLTLIYPYAQ